MKVHSAPSSSERRFGSWIGGSILASLVSIFYIWGIQEGKGPGRAHQIQKGHNFYVYGFSLSLDYRKSPTSPACILRNTKFSIFRDLSNKCGSVSKNTTNPVSRSWIRNVHEDLIRSDSERRCGEKRNEIWPYFIF